TQPDRTLREDHHRVTEPYAGTLRSREAGGHDVRTEHHVLVAQRVGDFGEVRLRVGHEHELGLTAVDGVAEAPSADGFIAVTHMAALRGRARQAGAALPAGRDGADDYTVAARIADDAGTHFLDHADRFMPDNQA